MVPEFWPEQIEFCSYYLMSWQEIFFFSREWFAGGKRDRSLEFTQELQWEMYV